MNKILTMDNIKEYHEALSAMVLKNRGIFSKQNPEYKGSVTERNNIIAEVNKLINDITTLSATVDSFEDYLWLSDAALKWESMFSTIFEDPKTIILSQPKTSWQPQLPPKNEEFSDNAINEWVKRQAAFIAYARIVDRGGDFKRFDSSPVEQNWHESEIFFASEVIEGRINFAYQISPKSYWRLENIWLKEVKCLMAYFEWIDKENKTLFSYHDKDFYDATHHIRKDLLINSTQKASISKFDNVKSYIQEHYIGLDNKLLLPSPGTDIHKLIKNKAYRIYATTGEMDSDKNWQHAETYVKMFYENIIPAIEKKDKEKILRVLKAFQFSKMNRFIIINCFETAITICFMDQDIIKELWNESAQKSRPKSTVESIVYVKNLWPGEFVIKENYGCHKRFWFDRISRDKIFFSGVMLPEEKDDILNALENVEPDKPNLGVSKNNHIQIIKKLNEKYKNSSIEFRTPKEEHIMAIEELYNHSRLIHEETTL